jgi:hypothetical protein
MKKLLVLLFTFAVVFSLAMPVFAQDTGQAAPTTTEKKTKKTKATKAKKAKTTKSTEATTPPSQ